MKKLTIMSLVTAAAITLSASEAKADTDPRDYSGIMALPSQTAVVLAYYRHITTNDSASSEQNLALLRATYVLKWGNFLLDPLDFILPVVDVTAHVHTGPGPLNQTLFGAGLGDLIIVPTIVYEIPEGPSSSTFMGASEYVFAPTGNYDDTKAINIGGNHWGFKSEIMLGQKFAKRHTFEILGNIEAFTANDDSRTENGEIHSLHNKPVAGFEAHYMADVAPFLGVGASFYATNTGRSFYPLDGQAGSEITASKEQLVESVRVTAAIRVEKQSLLFLQFQQDVNETNGGSIGHWVGARISHFF